MSRLNINHAGEVHGHVTLLSLAYMNDKSLQFWNGRCSCGVEKVFSLGNLVAGNTTSCGCARMRLGGLSYSVEYKCWIAIQYRCSPTATAQQRKNYYDRGIRVCKKWRNKKTGFMSFLRDMGGRPPDKCSIERLNNDGNYEPKNCCWATMKEQSLTKRKRKPVIDKPGKTYNQWTTVRYISVGRSQKWLCRCSCGTEKVVELHTLKSGTSKSCGKGHYGKNRATC